MVGPEPYAPTHPATSAFEPLRGLRLHVNRWGRPRPGVPLLVLLHGWMDVGASWQFVVDALAAADTDGLRAVVAPDWRGFGRTEAPPTDAYAFHDYLGDLDALLDALSPDAPVDLVGHSMGGNVAMAYAGVRPARVRRLVNVEGFGMPQTDPDDAPARLARWLDDLKVPQRLRDYDSAEAVADRLRANDPRLRADRAAWLARQWAQPRADGRWHLLADPAHKRVNPVLARREEALAAWRRIQAPVLWIEGDATDMRQWWGDRYPRADFEARIAQVPNLQRAAVADCGHMLHHDRPEALAGLLMGFLGAGPGGA